MEGRASLRAGHSAKLATIANVGGKHAGVLYNMRAEIDALANDPGT